MNRDELRKILVANHNETLNIDQALSAITSLHKKEVEGLREKIINAINSFDGNSIIHTSYDDEPSITEEGVKKIADKIIEAINREGEV